MIPGFKNNSFKASNPNNEGFSIFFANSLSNVEAVIRVVTTFVSLIIFFKAISVVSLN
jgi:hypothetical protein